MSHDAAAASIADRLVYIRDGRIVEQSLPGDGARSSSRSRGWARLPHHPLAAGDAPLRRGRARGRTGSSSTPVEPALVAERGRGASPRRRRRPPPQAGEVAAELRAVGKRYASRGGERPS